MVTSMLDATADGHPPSQGALVLDGLRCRVRVRGWRARFLALAVALAGAGVAAATTGWVAWEIAARPWPSVAEAGALAAPVLPAGAAASVTRYDNVMGGSSSTVDKVLTPVLGAPEWDSGGVTFDYVRPSGAGLAGERARLAAAGWRTYSARGAVVGERNGMRIKVLTAGRTEGEEDLVVMVYPTPPRAAYLAAAAGALAGAALGWLAAAAGIARGRRGEPFPRGVRVLLATAGAAASAPAALLTLVAAGFGDAGADAAPPWFGFEVFGARPAGFVGAMLLCVAYVLSLGRGVERRVDPWVGTSSTVDSAPA